MKKLISMFLTLAVALYCLPAVFADDTESAITSVSVESFDSDEGISGGAGYDSIYNVEGGGALMAFGKSIEISREGLDIQLGESAKKLKYAHLMLYTETPDSIDTAQSTLTVTMGSMQKKSNIFKDAQLKEGWNALCAVILVSGSAPVTGYTLNIVSKDDSDLSVKVDDLCLTETNKLTKPDAFSGIFEKANSFDTSVLSVAEMTVFSLFSGEAETDRQLELYAKGLEDLMNKYENKAAADAELSQKNIGSSNLLIRGRAFYDEGGLRMGYGACGFTVRFYGTTLTGDFSFVGGAATDGGRSHYNVYVDTDDYCYDFDTSLPFPECRDKYNETTPSFTIIPGSVNKIVLCGKDEGVIKGLSEGVHTVTVLKRGEGGGRTSNGLLNSLSCDGNFLTPPKNNIRNIEVIGDSDAAAFGNLSIGTNLPWDPETQDTTLSYASRVANFFGANFSVTAKSGVCLLKSPKANEGYYTDNYFFTDNWSVGDKYTYDFASHKSDLVFISLGGNDYGRIQPTDEEFTAGMIKFIRQVRSVNPDSVIFVSGDRSRTAVNTVNAQGDKNVFIFTIGLSPRAAASGHPSMTAHIEGAARMENAIKTALNWNAKQHEIFSDPTIQNGSFEFSSDYNEVGEKVYITPKAADGYAFKEDSITAKTVNGDALITEKDENGFYILAPNAMVIVSGEFEEKQGPSGDVDGDGKVTVTDALLILQNSVNIIEFTNEQISAADLDKDGNVTVTDALLALQISVGKI